MHPRGMCASLLPALVSLPSKSRDLTHTHSYPTVSYERELHSWFVWFLALRFGVRCADACDEHRRVVGTWVS